MKFRPFKPVQNLMAAVILLTTLLACAEMWLRSRGVTLPSTVSSTVAPDLQPLLEPCDSCFHHLRAGAATLAAGVKTEIHAPGYRGEAVQVPKPAGVYRGVLLGDETVFGPAIPDDRTLAAWLQQLLRKSAGTHIEVVNAGLPGSCPLLAWLHYQQQLRSLQPDLVILHFDMSDVADDADYRRYLVLNESTSSTDAGSIVSPESAAAVEQSATHPHVLAIDGTPGAPRCIHPLISCEQKTENVVVGKVCRSAIGTWLISQARAFVGEDAALSHRYTPEQAPFAWIGDNPPDLRIQVRHTLEPIEQLREAVKSDGGELLVTTAPVLWQLQPASDAPLLSERFQIDGVTPYSRTWSFRVIREYCAAIHVPFLDVTDAFRQSGLGAKLFSPTAPVLSEYGTVLYARELAHAITSGNAQVSLHLRDQQPR
ncbi:MAG: SGNH/GDSL hydrolase family protein [Planctomycetaceae bacterium]|nr:SGNH/GDSL hydrolase family protein [Planctomycetaceae bacterium]